MKRAAFGSPVFVWGTDVGPCTFVLLPRQGGVLETPEFPGQPPRQSRVVTSKRFSAQVRALPARPSLRLSARGTRAKDLSDMGAAQ
jgi:hypothetical protein